MLLDKKELEKPFNNKILPLQSGGQSSACANKSCWVDFSLSPVSMRILTLGGGAEPSNCAPLRGCAIDKLQVGFRKRPNLLQQEPVTLNLFQQLTSLASAQLNCHFALDAKSHKLVDCRVEFSLPLQTPLDWETIISSPSREEVRCKKDYTSNLVALLTNMEVRCKKC